MIVQNSIQVLLFMILIPVITEKPPRPLMYANVSESIQKRKDSLGKPAMKSCYFLLTYYYDFFTSNLKFMRKIKFMKKKKKIKRNMLHMYYVYTHMKSVQLVVVKYTNVLLAMLLLYRDTDRHRRCLGALL